MPLVIDSCEGPLIWYPLYDPWLKEVDAILECSRCPYLIVTGNLNDEAHAVTPIIREGFPT